MLLSQMILLLLVLLRLLLIILLLLIVGLIVAARFSNHDFRITHPFCKINPYYNSISICVLFTLKQTSAPVGIKDCM